MHELFRTGTLLKQNTPLQLFSCAFSVAFRKSFFHERVRIMASVSCKVVNFVEVVKLGYIKLFFYE